MAKRKIATIQQNDITAVVRYDSEFSEYSVHLVGQSSDSDYFTDSKEDALQTAHIMVFGE